MLRSDLCDHSDAYIAVKGRITVAVNTLNNRANKKVAFKNNVPFKSCMLKINNTFIDNTEDLHIVMPMYNFLEYSDNYSMTLGSLWNYYRDEMNDAANGDAANYRVNNDKTTRIRCFE